MIDLSIIIISRNQAWNIGRLIESVQREAANIKTKEIVLVDSASTDSTVDIAGNYPINILRLRPDQRLTPAAGRYIGYKHTKGELVLFLDGDMELCPDWLAKSFQVFKTKPDVAVVTGKRIDLQKTARRNDKPAIIKSETISVTEITYSGGAAIYKRSVLDEVGSFNPYLHSDEEPDLCIRILHAGYRIIQIHQPIVYHYSDPMDVLSTKVARWKRNLYLGAGQNIRYHLGSEIFWPYLKERGFGVIPGVGFFAGLFAFLWFWISGQGILFLVWILFLGVFLAADIYRKRSLYRTLVSLLERLLICEGTIRGFLMKPLDPNKYSGNYDVVK